MKIKIWHFLLGIKCKHRYMEGYIPMCGVKVLSNIMDGTMIYSSGLCNKECPRITLIHLNKLLEEKKAGK